MTASRFREWTFDDERRELRGPAGAVHLSPKAFDLLAALLAGRPRVHSKRELRDLLWPNTSVADSSLAGLVKEVRQALGDDARNPAFLRTVHAFGYAFCADVVAGPPTADAGGAVTAHLSLGEREFRLVEGENVLGRLGGAFPSIDSRTVSRRHARVLVSADGAVIEDLGSKNGTYVRGERLTGPTALADGDEIQIGSVLLTFRRSFSAVSTASHSGPVGKR
jgi:DNA-binding winged helix-turn-helix (wHTH) protein